jgi:hypothetical protein
MKPFERSGFRNFGLLPPYYQYKLHFNSLVSKDVKTTTPDQKGEDPVVPEIKPFKLDLTSCASILKTTPTSVQDETLVRNEQEKKTAEVLMSLGDALNNAASASSSIPQSSNGPTPDLKAFRTKWKDQLITKKNKKQTRKHPHVIHRNSNACSQHRKKHQRCPLECIGRIKDQQLAQQQQQNGHVLGSSPSSSTPHSTTPTPVPSPQLPSSNILQGNIPNGAALPPPSREQTSQFLLSQVIQQIPIAAQVVSSHAAASSATALGIHLPPSISVHATTPIRSETQQSTPGQ